MGKKKKIIILVGLLVLVSASFLVYKYIKSTTKHPANGQLLFKKMCDPESLLFQNRFWHENEIIELVGKYNYDTLELTHYHPSPCLEWTTGSLGKCSMRYTKSVNGKLTLTEEPCSDSIKSSYPDFGAYTVDIADCFPEGANYPWKDDCTILVDDPETKRACYLEPIKLNKALENIKPNSYVYIKGYLSPSESGPKKEAEQFMITVDSFKNLPIRITTDEATKVCNNHLSQNRDSINKYCFDNGYSCGKENIRPDFTVLSQKEKWTTYITIGIKELRDRDNFFELNYICEVNPYTGKISNSTICSRDGGCLVCE